MNDILGDRMKGYEGQESMRVLDHNLPIMIRLDGRSFHTFTKGLNRPYDERFNTCMKETARFVMEECNANLAYTQSDEITLVILTKGSPFFAGRVQKLCSVASSAATVMFNNKVRELLHDYAKKMPMFDARVWNVPSLVEAANAVLWRELDAEKNSVSMMAQSAFSQKILQNKNSSEMKQMLKEIGKSWEDLPISFQRGTYLKKTTLTKKFEQHELVNLPEKHLARTNPDLVFERSIISEIVFPRLITVENKEDLLFKN